MTTLLSQLEELEQQGLDVFKRHADEQKERMNQYMDSVKAIVKRRGALIMGKEEPLPEELEGFKPSTPASGSTLPTDGSNRIPFFWLSAILNTSSLRDHVTARDKRALEYLDDVHVVWDEQGLSAVFVFRENPYFYNQVLRRGLFMLDPALVGDEEADEEALTSEQSTDIEWKDGMNLTMEEVVRAKAVKKKGKGRKGGGRGGEEAPRMVTTYKPCASFFRFFAPILRPAKAEWDPTLADADEDDIDEEELQELQEKKQSQDGKMLTAIVNELVPTAGNRYLEAPIFSLPPLSADGEPSPEDEDYEIITSSSPSGPDCLPVPVQKALHALTTLQRKMDALLEASQAEERESTWNWYLKWQGICAERRQLLVHGTPLAEDAAYFMTPEEAKAGALAAARARVAGEGVTEGEGAKGGSAKGEGAKGAGARGEEAKGESSKGEIEAEEDEGAEQGGEGQGQGVQLAIPRFWLLALMGVPRAWELVQKQDEPILAYLADVRWLKPKPPTFQSEPPPTLPSGTLELEFLPNPYFRQRVLRKTYHMEGDRVVMGKAEEVEWCEGRDPTLRAGSGGRAKGQRSFFCLFKSGGELRLFGLSGNSKEEQAEVKEWEGELVMALRQELIPTASEMYRASLEQYGPDGTLGEEEDEEGEESEEEEDEEGSETEGEEAREERRAARAAARAAKKLSKKKKSAGEGGQSWVVRNSRWILLAVLVIFVAAELFVFFDAVVSSRPTSRKAYKRRH